MNKTILTRKKGFLILWFCYSICVYAQNESDSRIKTINNYITTAIKDSEIPGISFVFINKNELTITNFGFANLKEEKYVTAKTLFELGSSSVGFTALAILKLQREGKIKLSAKVTEFIPWFHVYYNGSEASISINQLLHHTSGIPFNTLSLIPQSNSNDALEQTIKKIIGISLHYPPGKQFEYAAFNYNILALIVEKVTGKKFETYIEENIFKELGLYNTSIGKPLDISLMAKGYKVGFFKHRDYEASIYKGNNAAGYVISNAEDMAKWLRYQLGLIPSKFDTLIKKTHLRDESVMPQDLYSYAYGWYVSLKGDGEIYNGGLNPNYTSYIAFRKDKEIGVVLLANSNSPFTQIIGQNVMKILAGEEATTFFNPDNSTDKAFSVLSIIFCIYLLFVIAFIGYIIYGLIKKNRKYESITFKKIIQILSVFIFLIPFLYGIYLIPKAMFGFSWEAVLVWFPMSLPVAITLCLACIGLSLIAFIISVIFPEKNKYVRDAPKIILLSILSGISNVVVILLITSSLSRTTELKYILYYFGITIVLYLLGRKIVQTKLIYLSRNIIYDLRIKLIGKVFSTSYENFEKIDRGRIYTTLNDDIGTIGDSANTIVNITTSLITAVGAFLYMVTLAFWATLITVLIIASISTLYYFVSRKTQVYFEEARETRTVYMRLLNGMIDGFKELSIHRNKKMEYKNDVEISTDEYRKKICKAHIKFANAFLIGESLLIAVLATVAFALPIVFPNVPFTTVMSFIIILLYLIGPINAILGSVPQIMQLKISWDRVQCFINDIPANSSLKKLEKSSLLDCKIVHSIKIQSVTYKYNDSSNKDGFYVGPISFEVKKGEALFIIGGNGSGKTTLAKLITGLYTPLEGEILINNKKMNSTETGEYFSAVFNPFHLFQKIYNIDLEGKTEELTKLLTTMQLENKVNIKDNEYSTIELSGGQRKRLALLQCYLEDKPIYLFDEWAADQDPEYRKFFYRELITKMKEQGKIIIAITHDDHYFDVADKVLKLDMGKVEFLKNTNEIEKRIFTAKA